jgi:hypothetical protein
MIRHQSDPGAILQICSTKRNCLPHNEPIAMIFSATSEPACVATLMVQAGCVTQMAVRQRGRVLSASRGSVTSFPGRECGGLGATQVFPAMNGRINVDR